MYDITIIGAGIAGLHCAYRLQSHFQNIVVLEQSHCIGGRIQSVQLHGHTIEAGAGRLNQHHVLFQSLLREMNLHTLPIQGDISFYDPYSPFHSQNPFTTLTKVLNQSKKEPITKLQKITFLQYAKLHLTSDEIDFLLSSFGYYQQLVEMNAYDAVKLFDKGMHSKNDFSIVKGGMSQIIHKLHSKLDSDLCTVHCNSTVESIDYISNLKCFRIVIENRTKPIYSRFCIAAIPKYALMKLQYCKPIFSRLNTIKVKVLCRIYAFFRKSDIWFRELPKTTVNNEIRYIIPIDRKNGILMISYTDSQYAQFWSKLPQSKVLSTLQSKLQEVFNRKIPRPYDVKAYYWQTGTAFWKPKINSRLMSHRILQPNLKRPFYICGENYSTTQGWVEGALETSNQVIDAIVAEKK